MKKISNKEIQLTLATVVKRLVENLDVEKIILFGSYVKGFPISDINCRQSYSNYSVGKGR